MIKSKRFFAVLIVFALISISCRLVSEIADDELEGGSAPPSVAETAAAPIPPTSPPEAPSATDVPEAAPTPAGEVPLEGGFPPQTNAAAIQPPERRAELTILSNLIRFQAIDYFGAPLGVVVDYVINTCETYIIYFLVEPVDALKPASGDYVVIPFEAVTINNGVIDAATRSIQVHMSADQLVGAPAFPEDMHLTPTDWEEAVRSYWSQYFRLSNLKTECMVAQPGSSSGEKVAVYKIAYATHLMGAPLQDGLNNPLGLVLDAVLEPESGKLGFFIVELQSGELVLVHLSAVNIPESALEPGGEMTLVLLKENHVLENAPRINNISEATDAAVQQTAREYWAR
jgi:sporulation protein YlmC with PRC-barrel domain